MPPGGSLRARGRSLGLAIAGHRGAADQAVEELGGDLFCEAARRTAVSGVVPAIQPVERPEEGHRGDMKVPVITDAVGYDFLSAFGLLSADIHTGDLITFSLNVRGII